jgi:acetaldehyde dehydrogenase/alcohol dehydrogenase
LPNLLELNSGSCKGLIGEVNKIELDEPFAHEKLSPVLAMYKAKTFDEALDKAEALIELGGFWSYLGVIYRSGKVKRQD